MSPSSPPRPRHSPWLFVLVLALACGEAGEVEQAPPVAEATPLQVEPLSDDDLAGLDPSKVAINIPWGSGLVSRDPATAAPHSTVFDLTIEEHGSFDRLVMEFGTQTPFPGYRVAWADSAASACGTPIAVVGGGRARPLLVRVGPARAHTDDGRPTLDETERSTGYAAVIAARQLCDEDGVVEWALEVSDSTAVRVLEMREPPRLVVDIAHPGAPTADARGDSTTAGGG